MTSARIGDSADEHTDVDEQVFEPHLASSLGVTLVLGAAVAAAAWRGALPLLVAVAVVQAVAALGWVLGTSIPGRKGGLVLCALAAAGADVAVTLWPHSRLGALTAVIGLALPAMFVHQLMRGAARTRIVASLSAVAVAVVLVVSPAALLQLRHEFVDPALGGRVVAAVVAAAVSGVALGYLVDLVVPWPRFDHAVPRGLLALVASAVLAAAVAPAVLRNQPAFADGRAAFVGAALGAVAGLLSMAGSFVLFTTPDEIGTRRLTRPLLMATLPLCLLAPAAFLLCLAIRT